MAIKKDENGDFVIVPEEAKTVKLIYDLYLEGNSIVAIRRELEKRSIPSPTGKRVGAPARLTRCSAMKNTGETPPQPHL